MVAEAVVTACDLAVDRSVAANIAEGAPGETEAQIREDLRAIALMRVVQARAGHCAKPVYVSPF